MDIDEVMSLQALALKPIYRSIDFCRATTTIISNLWWYFLPINADNGVL
jgi:hypothetical protein